MISKEARPVEAQFQTLIPSLAAQTKFNIPLQLTSGASESQFKQANTVIPILFCQIFLSQIRKGFHYFKPHIPTFLFSLLSAGRRFFALHHAGDIS
jgi:hypothetical protein